jgi:phenylalanyl-tRNA synthetase beta chain
MPTIEASYSDLQELIGTHVPLDVLRDEGIMYAKGELDGIDGEKLKLDMKDTNRPDLWSIEGVARELAGRYAGRTGLPKYTAKPSGIVVKVDRKLAKIRPLTVCAVVRSLNITEDVLSQMIQLQEKVAMTFGRNRKEVAIGVYDLHKITSPIRFTSVKPDGIKFVPLESSESMTPAEILVKHQKGVEYAGLLRGLSEYPIFIDAEDEVLSMPPIINSDHTGKVTSATHDVFIECSGFSMKFLMPALNVMVAALADRGGEIQTVTVEYPDGKKETPDMSPKKASLDIAYAKSLTGLDLTPKQMCALLGQARYDAKVSGKRIEVLYPAYRQDIMHPRDIVEDMLISYGYNKVKPKVPTLPTAGAQEPMELFCDGLAEVMVGMGFQEVMSYMLTNKESVFGRMGLPEGKVVEIENFVSSGWCVFRSWLLPSSIEFLSCNLHREYPQRIFEIGDVIVPDAKAETRARDERRLSASFCGIKAGYEHMASALDALLSSIGIEYKLRPAQNPAFIPGRTAEVVCGSDVIGIVGEIHPRVLNAWKIEMPVASFELDAGKLRELSLKKN